MWGNEEVSVDATHMEKEVCRATKASNERVFHNKGYRETHEGQMTHVIFWEGNVAQNRGTRCRNNLAREVDWDQ